LPVPFPHEEKKIFFDGRRLVEKLFVGEAGWLGMALRHGTEVAEKQPESDLNRTASGENRDD
jgi:hypothetical protein